MTTTSDIQLKELEIASIKIDFDIQSRTILNDTAIKDYAENYLTYGDLFPPVAVFFDGSDYWLAHGCHRVSALLSIGKTAVRSNIHQGDKRAAVLYSVAANEEHGLRRTPGDKRKAVLKLLNDAEWGQWSSMEIARRCKVSHTYVNEIRKSLETVSSEKTYQTKHGTVAKMKTAEIGRKKEASEPILVPTPITNEEALEIKVRELADTINELAEENTLLKDKIAIGQWDATEIEKIEAEELIADLRKQIKILEMENKSLRDSRNMFQNRNSELMRTVKALTNKLKKLESAKEFVGAS